MARTLTLTPHYPPYFPRLTTSSALFSASFSVFSNHLCNLSPASLQSWLAGLIEGGDVPSLQRLLPEEAVEVRGGAGGAIGWSGRGRGCSDIALPPCDGVTPECSYPYETPETPTAIPSNPTHTRTPRLLYYCSTPSLFKLS